MTNFKIIIPLPEGFNDDEDEVIENHIFIIFEKKYICIESQHILFVVSLLDLVAFVLFPFTHFPLLSLCVAQCEENEPTVTCLSGDTLSNLNDQVGLNLFFFDLFY